MPFLNVKALMTSDILHDWLIGFDNDMKRQKNKVIMIVNDCLAHQRDADRTLSR